MKRKLTVIVGVLALALGATACSSNSSNTPAAKKPYIAIISKGFQAEFWQAVKAGADQAAKDLNVTVTFEGAQQEGNVDEQIQLLQTTIDKHPAAIGFAAIDSQAAGPLMEQAKSGKIPVIAFDSGVDSDVPLTHRGH